MRVQSVLCVDAQLTPRAHRMTSDAILADASQYNSSVMAATTVAIGQTNATAVSIYESPAVHAHIQLTPLLL